MLLLIILIVNLLNLSLIDSFVNKARLKEIIPNNSTLTITSIIFNEDSTTSQYINHIFGDKAIYLHKKVISNDDGSDYNVYKNFINKGRENIRQRLELTEHELTPECSFELLGMTYLNATNHPMYYPFTSNYRNRGPAIGKGKFDLSMIRRRMKIKCYYRGLYENWIDGDYLFSPYYWPTVIYCPVINSSYCDLISNFQVNSDEEYNKFRIAIYLHNITYATNLYATLPKTFVRDETRIDVFQPKLGICVAIPHISSDNGKVAANSAMLFEWIRYYLKLGLRVFVYDRDGNNYDYVFNSVYSVSRGFDKETIHNLVYNNFTIRGLLNPSFRGATYDNTITNDLNKFISDSDKQLTLTHCRFDAKAKYNIEDIIVSDFDEFLYCPSVGPSAFNQSKFIHYFLSFQRSSGYDQLTFKQRAMANTTESIRDCIIDAATVNTSKSIFDCFAPYDYWTNFHSIKSLHIGLKCPFTGFHSSCPYEKGSILSHDCLCNSAYIRDECQFIHLTTNYDSYFKDAYIKYTNMSEIILLQSFENELNLVTKSSSIFNYYDFSIT